MRDSVIIICPEHGEFKQRAMNHLLGRGGCPGCNYKSEFKCRLAFENYFKTTFPKSYPSFLNGQEYDGYNETLQIAFEYNGEQHYKAISIFGGMIGFKKTQERDERKRRLSVINNVILLVIPYTITDFTEYIENYFYFL